MAESTNQDGAAPTTITQGQTTSVGENAQTVIEAEAAPVEAEQQSLFANPILWIAAALWLYLLFGNKKRKAMRQQQKQEQARRESLEKGDEIVTIGRMHGTVVAYTDSTVTIKPDVKADYTMTFDRQAIYKVLPRPGEDVVDEAGTGK